MDTGKWSRIRYLICTLRGEVKTKLLEVHHPVLLIDGFGGQSSLRPLDDEVGQHLRLDSLSRSVRDVSSHQLDPLLGNAPSGLGALDDLTERELGHYRDRVGLEVVPEFASRD